MNIYFLNSRFVSARNRRDGVSASGIPGRSWRKGRARPFWGTLMPEDPRHQHNFFNLGAQVYNIFMFERITSRRALDVWNDLVSLYLCGIQSLRQDGPLSKKIGLYITSPVLYPCGSNLTIDNLRQKKKYGRIVQTKYVFSLLFQLISLLSIKSAIP